VVVLPDAERNPFRVRVYRACGGVVLVALALAALTGAPFWSETFAGVAIGTGWLLRACEPDLMIGSEPG